MVDVFLFRSAIRDLLRVKRVVASVGLALLPSALALLIRLANPGGFDPYMVYNTVATTIVYGFLLVILSVVFFTGVITQEMEQKTIVYLLTRPVPRWRIAAAKYAAALIGIVVTLSLSAALLAVATVGLGGRAGASLLSQSDVIGPDEFRDTIGAAEDPISQYIKAKAWEPPRWRRPQGPGQRPRPSRSVSSGALVQRIARALRTDREFYSPARFEGLELPQELTKRAASHPKGLALTRLNRELLEAAYPSFIHKRAAPELMLWRDLMVLPLGAMAYGALFLFLATFVRRPLIFGILFAFGWESWVPNMPGRFQLVSIMSYLRVLAPHPSPPAESVDLLQFFGGIHQESISVALSGTVLGATIGIALGAALLLFSWREFVPRDDVE